METIKEDYVSFETAKLLKEKGFDEGCRAHYGTAGSFSYEKYEVEASECEMHNAILAPTLQMAMKWLREAHRLFICVEIGVGAYAWNITNTTDYVIVYADATVGTYEEACEAAIKYCLEKLIRITMAKEDKKEIEELKEYFPLEVLNNEEIEHCQKLSKNGYTSVVKYLKNVHPEIGLKEAKIYYDLYFNN